MSISRPFNRKRQIPFWAKRSPACECWQRFAFTCMYSTCTCTKLQKTTTVILHVVDYLHGLQIVRFLDLRLPSPSVCHSKSFPTLKGLYGAVNGILLVRRQIHRLLCHGDLGSNADRSPDSMILCSWRRFFLAASRRCFLDLAAGGEGR